MGRTIVIVLIHATKLIVSYWHLMSAWIQINIDTISGLLPDSTKPLLEPMLTSH